MAFSSSAMGLEKGFAESLKKEQEELKAARTAEAREKHRRKSFSQGSQYVLRALRRMRSQKLWTGFSRWRDFLSHECKPQSQEAITLEDRKLAEISNTLIEVNRIVQETRLSNAVEEQNRKDKLLNAEAEAAAERDLCPAYRPEAGGRRGGAGARQFHGCPSRQGLGPD